MDMTGHNSQLTDDERKAVFVSHAQKGYAQHLKVKAEQKALSDIHKAAKVADIHTYKLREIYKAMDAEDEQLPAKHLSERLEALRWFGFAKGDQLDMFSADAGDDVIYQSGFRAGQMNKDKVSGFSKGSQDDETWLRAYDEGRAKQQADLDSALQKIQAEEEGTSDLDDDGHQQAAE